MFGIKRMTEEQNKYNDIIPEWSTEEALWFKIDKPISQEGFDNNFLPKIKGLLDSGSGMRIGLYFEQYKGYERDAVGSELAALLEYGKYVNKIAVLNPPEKVILHFKLKQPLIEGEIKYFEMAQQDEAIAWLKE